MNPKGVFSGDKIGYGPSGAVEVGGSKPVSLEAFFASNWQILTILGVFAGFTNYVKITENPWLVTLVSLLTFIISLEILQLLFKIKNKSKLLKTFTLLSVVFIVIYALFIYSTFFSDTFAGFTLDVYSLSGENIALIAGIVLVLFILTLALVFLRHPRSASAAVLKPRLRGDKNLMVWSLSALLVCAMVLAFFLWLGSQPASYESPPTSTTTSTVETCNTPNTRIGVACCRDSDNNSLCDGQEVSTTTTEATTTTITPTITTTQEIACTTNGDCGNQTQTRICYETNVYLQKVTSRCQKPGTPEARCIYKTSLEGETITQEATPYERCSKGCKDGNCTD